MVDCSGGDRSRFVDCCFSLKYQTDLDFGQMAGHTAYSVGF